MNRLHRLLLLAVLAAAALPSRAQYTPSLPARPFPGYVNERLRAADPYRSVWDVGVNVRSRLENKDGAGFTDAGQNWDFSANPSFDNHNTYQLLRVMPRVAYAGKRGAFLVEGRASYSFGDERFATAGPGRGLAERDGPLDLHQAYFFWGNHKEYPVSLKLGRQELVYGDQRLVGHLRWNNNARTFDTVKVRWQNAIFGVDLFTGGLVYNDHHNLNRAHLGRDTFSGAYFNWPAAATKAVVESYLLARNVTADIASVDFAGVAAPFRLPAKQDLYTAGLRIRSKPGSSGPWDYGVELMHQFGNRATTAPAATPAAVRAAARLDQSAWAAVLQGGYTWTDHAWQPRLGALYSYASGDRNPTDGRSQTFQNLFATTHLHYGYMDLSSLQNLHDFRLAYAVRPLPQVSIALEGHLQSLATSADFWYNVGGVFRNAGGYATRGHSNQVGRELDLAASWNPVPSTQLEIGLGRYFRGDYIKESLADNGGSKDAKYCYVQITLSL
ncbi:MAG: alginate export family protein [Verrucomicrobia bacterium]|nr:alginate export family protein [Verrucomicrobiota bacterium]